ncbi:MAG: YqjF family protein [Sphingomonadales bacterium]|jgi:uncharacterized protein YqjF (DUF2071 family)
MLQTFLTARWENLIMANYAVPPEVLKPYLPAGVEPDLFEGEAFVSLVGFMFKNTRLFGVLIPFMGSFEEVNLRFYVKREEQGEIRRGVVFVNETVPYKPVAWLANKLYKEHYTAIPTRHYISELGEEKHIQYEWIVNGEWNQIQVNASPQALEMQPGSHEEFIFEHYYGYTHISENHSQEYQVQHPRWRIHPVNNYHIQCDFGAFYGPEFEFLNNATPSSVILAQGSEVSVKWKRRNIWENS